MKEAYKGYLTQLMFEITELPMLYNTELEFYKFETRSPLNIANISLFIKHRTLCK